MPLARFTLVLLSRMRAHRRKAGHLQPADAAAVFQFLESDHGRRASRLHLHGGTEKRTALVSVLGTRGAESLRCRLTSILATTSRTGRYFSR